VSVAVVANPLLVQRRNELDAIQRDLAHVFEEAGQEYDLSRVKRIGLEDVSSMAVKDKSER
jgi:hypothetical protein